MTDNSDGGIDIVLHPDDDDGGVTPRYRPMLALAGGRDPRRARDRPRVVIPSTTASPVSPVSPPTNNGYDAQVEALLKKLYEQASAARFLHAESAAIVQKRQKWLSLPARILAGLIGSGSAMSLINYSSFTLFDWVLTVVTILGSILNIIDSFSDYSQRELRHNFYKSSFNEVCTRISTNMSLPPEARPSGFNEAREVAARIAYLSNGNSPDILPQAERRLSLATAAGATPETYSRPGRLERLFVAIGGAARSPRSPRSPRKSLSPPRT